MSETCAAVCRLCLQEAFELASVFQYRNGKLVADLIREIIPEINIERKDNLSQQICVSCLSVVLNACDLRSISIQNDVAERERKAEITSVKIEPFDIKQEDFMENNFVENLHTIKESDEMSSRNNYSSDNSSDFGNYERKRTKFFKEENLADFECRYCGRYLTSSSMLILHIKVHHPTENQGKFKCDICELQGESRIFKLKTGIEQHMQASHTSDAVKKPCNRNLLKVSNEKNFNCNECKTYFQTRVALMRHQKKYHAEKIISFQCKFCATRFRKQKSYEKHMAKHGKLPYGPRALSKICDVCFLEFNSRPEMRLHKFIHCDFVEEFEEPEQKVFACALCKFDSYFEEEIKTHLVNHKSDFSPQAILVCLRCSWTFQDYEMLVKHTEMHNMKITHRCLRCLKKFPYGPKFLRHIERHLSYTCDLCGTNESSKGRLEDHIKVAHMKVVMHLCPICGESRKTSGSLQSHIRSRHDGERKFQCTLCPKAFLTPTYLRNHQSVHSNELNFPCTKCPKKFRTFRNLKRHQVYHDPSKLNYKHVCDQEGCGRSFLNKFGLDRHMLTHTGLRPWVCSVVGCDRAFSQSNDLNKHLRSHYGDCIYNCDFPGCSMAFKLKGELREHQTDHYKK